MTMRTSRQRPFDDILLEQANAERCVREFIDDLLTNCAEIVHSNYLQTQIKPYAARTIAHELIMNSSWAKLSVGPQIFGIVPDDDLPMPRVDQWSNGALVVESPEDAHIRSSVCEFREPEKMRKPRRSAGRKLTHPDARISAQASCQSAIFAARKPSQPKSKPETNAIVKIFDDAKKQVQTANKNVTVDAELNVIPIQEPKALSPSLIVPRVTLKRAPTKPDASPPARRPKPTVQRKSKKPSPSRTLLPGLEEDTPIFDEEVVDVSVTDKFICMPGVTLRDGSIVKSKPNPQKASGLTKSQYESQANNL